MYILSGLIGFAVDALFWIMLLIPLIVIYKKIKKAVKKHYEIEQYKAETERIKAEAARASATNRD